MKKALDQAVLAFDQNEVPVGCVIVYQERVIAEAYNQREALNDPTAHCEMIAITQAAEVLGSWRPAWICTLYVTLEPCPMCAGAIVQARIPNVIYGTSDPKGGACHTLYQITEDPRLNHQCSVMARCHAGRFSLALLQEFFSGNSAHSGRNECQILPTSESTIGFGGCILRQNLPNLSCNGDIADAGRFRRVKTGCFEHKCKNRKFRL